MSEILDSGTRREFSSGAVRDMASGKGRMDLLPWAAIMEVSKHCENGARKYGEHNVDKGLPVSSFCDSAARHLAKHIDGWDDEPHLLAAAWNLLWAIQMEIKHPGLVDVPVYGVAAEDIDNAPTVDAWVSVKDRLPDCKGEYLVAYHPCYWDEVKEETVVGYDSYRGGASWARNKYQRVTHWMPMPEPPKPH